MIFPMSPFGYVESKEVISRYPGELIYIHLTPLWFWAV